MVWAFMTGIEERGLGTLREMLGLGLCAERKFQKMRHGTRQHLEVRDMGWGICRGGERGIGIQVRINC